MQIIDRFESKFIPEPNSGCWLWFACFEKEGYGRFFDGKKVIRAHRYAWAFYKGKIKTGLYIDHLCRNRACVNPDHLEPVTNKENILRGAGLGAKWARRLVCSLGHPLDLKRTDGGRKCSICVRNANRLHMRSHRARKKGNR